RCNYTKTISPIPDSQRHLRELLDSRPHFLTDNLPAIEIIPRGVDKAWNNQTAEVEHETIGQTHDGHVARRATGGAQEADNLVFPDAAGQLDQVLDRGVDVVVVDRGGDDDDPCLLNERGQRLNSRVTIGHVAVAKGERVIAEVYKGSRNVEGSIIADDLLGHEAAIACGPQRRREDEVFRGRRHRKHQYLA